jgi:hypothetical protein
MNTKPGLRLGLFICLAAALAAGCEESGNSNADFGTSDSMLNGDSGVGVLPPTCQLVVSRSGATVSIGAPVKADQPFPVAGATYLVVGVNDKDKVVTSALFAFDITTTGHRANDAGVLVGKERTIKRDSVSIYLDGCDKLHTVYVYDRQKKVVAKLQVAP